MTVDHRHLPKPIYFNTCAGHDGEPHQYQHPEQRIGLCPQCWSLIKDQHAKTIILHRNDRGDKPYQTMDAPR
jgi:hypothetical protein